jgi:hypothetical protein
MRFATQRIDTELAQARRHNWSGTSDEQVPETCTYGGVGGRVSRRSTTVGLPLPSADTRINARAFTWNDLGQTASVGYPAHLGIGTDPARTVSFTYTIGFLTAVPSFAGSIGYYPNTMINQVAHANGVTSTYCKDLNDMAHPASPATAASLAGIPFNRSRGTLPCEDGSAGSGFPQNPRLWAAEEKCHVSCRAACDEQPRVDDEPALEDMGYLVPILVPIWYPFLSNRWSIRALGRRRRTFSARPEVSMLGVSAKEAT